MVSTPETTAELDELISTPTDAVIEAVGQCDGRFAVLGAGGKMGFHVSLMLRRALEKLNRREPVVTVSRFGSVETRQQFANAGFETVCADLSSADEISELPEYENVFYLAGVKFGTSGNPELLTRMNVLMPQLVARHFQRSRIVALSTGCVYSFTTPESGGSTEDSPTDPPGEYAQSCKGREAAFRDASEQFGTRSCLIRLNYSIDLRYGVLVDIAQKVRAGLPVDVSTGYANVIWQGDATAHIIQTLPYAAAPPFVLNVTGPETLSVRDIAHMFAERFGCGPTIEGEEQSTAWLSNASKSHSLFGRPRVGIEQMTSWIADWLEQGGETLNKPTHFEVRDGDY